MHQQSCQNCASASHFAIGAVLGALAGAAAAFLFAPKSGNEMRKDLKAMAQDARVRADLAAKEARDMAGHAGEKLHDAKHVAHHLAHEAKERMEDMRDEKKDA